MSELKIQANSLRERELFALHLFGVFNMRPLALAERYLEIFFSGENLRTLGEIFSEDFRFDGPLYHFASAEAYIDSLESDPPSGCSYMIIRAFENNDSACVVYEFRKPGVTAPMAQLFETRNGKISRILLIFDSSRF